MDKLELLSENPLNEVIDFIDFLLSKVDDINLMDIKKSLDDIKTGNVHAIESKSDLKEHFRKLKI